METPHNSKAQASRQHPSKSREESEDLFAIMADCAPVMLWMSGTDKLCNYFNQGWLDFTGRTLQQELGHGWAEGVHPDDYERCLNTYLTCFDSLLPFRMEYRLRRFDGQYRWILDSGTPRLNSDGTFAGYIGSCIDIDDQKRLSEVLDRLVQERTTDLAHANAELKTARDKALEASRFKTEFLANMSHEIRTPMNAVIGMIDLILQTPLNAEQNELATIAYSSAAALLGLLNDVLDLTKLEVGKLSLEIRDFNLLVLVEDAAELLAEKARKKRIALITYVPPDFPFMIRGDEGRLRQVLLNLIDNAIKFTDEGEVVLTVTSSADKSTMRVAVTDTGIGLSTQMQTRLFQPFTQADGSLTRKQGGTGLGLSISKHLIELMGGTIAVDSAEGAGSSFWFELPLEVSERESLPQVAKIELHDTKVLIAGAPKISSEKLVAYTRSLGMRPVLATSGDEVLNLLRQAASAGDPFKLAIIDHSLPGISVYEMGSSIRQNKLLASTKLILIIPFPEEDLEEMSTRSGFAAHLMRPLKCSGMLDCISSVLGGSKFRESDSEKAFSRTELAIDEECGPSALILVAEDNSANQKLAYLQLSKLGYQIHVAGNGLEAVQAVEKTCYSLIFMDCQMPEMNGFDAARAIRKSESHSGQHVPIIALTAHALTSDREKCLAAGMDDYISKPVTLDQLKETLSNWLPKTATVQDLKKV